MMMQHYQHVRRALPSEGFAHYRAAEGDARRFTLENRAGEEGFVAGPGDGREAQGHMDLIFGLCRFAGISDQQVRPTRWDCITEIYRTAVLGQFDPLRPGIAA